MNKKNNTKKSFKPAYVVDITACNDLYDTALAFAVAKQKAGQPLSDENVDIICAVAIDTFGDILDELGLINKENHLITPAANTICICECKEKPVKNGNIFKRFWSWLKHAFTW